MTVMLRQVLADSERLIRCESPSEDLQAVADSADLVADIGRLRLGEEPERIEIEGRTHLLWTWGGGPSRVLVLGHHDTVWPIGSLETHPFQIQEGILRGPGCVDMKVGLAMAMHAIAALPDRDGVTLLVTGDEELGSPSSRALIERSAAGCGAALVLEAAADGGAVKTARKGVSLYDVHAIGRASHAGLAPQAGVNALVELARQVLAVSALGDSGRGTTVTPTSGSAGTTSNTVPATARFAVDVRVRDVREQQRVDAAMRGLRPSLPDAQLIVTGGPNRAPLERAMSSLLYDRAVGLASALGLPPLHEAAVGGASDGNFTAGVGVPTLDGLGASGGGAHADDEHVIIDEIPGRTALLAALIADLLSESPTLAGSGRDPRSGAERS
ncbi:M20 family metallopeptidase [Allobranchiibius sp. GilTou38]|nr:M20 family metallopeptidase [Allobranchiibius sp. GilTou38]MBO1766760.1 M20 family metallopeptidase [Allobranchiibius sp. GilTou38]